MKNNLPELQQALGNAVSLQHCFLKPKKVGN